MSVVHGAVEIRDPQVCTSIAIFFFFYKKSVFKDVFVCQIHCMLNIEEDICDVGKVLKKL